MDIDFANSKTGLLEQSLEIFELDRLVQDWSLTAANEEVELKKAKAILVELEKALEEFKQNHQSSQRVWEDKWGALEPSKTDKDKEKVQEAYKTITHQLKEIGELRHSLELVSNSISPTQLQSTTDTAAIKIITSNTIPISAYLDQIANYKIRLNELLPLYWIGLHTRSRKLELSSRSQLQKQTDWAKVNQGNQAAHNGAALADASLYMRFCGDKKKTCKAEYVNMYGLAPETVWKYKDVSVLEILDWKEDMESFVGILQHCKVQGKLTKALRQDFTVS
jgi:hypothetical protein